MKQIDLAIIIPTLNEERYIGALLDSIINQTVQPTEIVVVDADSTDKTVVEIEKRKTMLPSLKVFVDKKYSIGRQRNRGVQLTNASNLLFLDADVTLPDSYTLMRYLNEVDQKNPDLASVTNIPSNWYWKDVVYFFGMNVILKTLKNIWPIALGMNLYVKRSIFEELRGFDEEIKTGEDVEFVQRAIKKGCSFLFLDNTTIRASTRRLQKEGRRKFARKMLKSFWYVRKHGYRNNPIEYEFGNFNPSKNSG